MLKEIQLLMDKLPPKSIRGLSCDTCNIIYFTYMITDDVWLSIFDNLKGYCCLKCLELKLGRELTIKDFVPTPINFNIIYGMERGCE